MVWDIICVLILLIPTVVGDFGPPYPLTGSWFKDRFSLSEWNSTLHEFSRQGGDTVILRAPALKLVEYGEFSEDRDFMWCGRNFRNNPSDEYRDCYHDAVQDLNVYDIKVSAILLYRYEENFDPSAIIQCPQYEKRIVSDRIYHRLVLPMSQRSETCDLNGTNVVLLFTVYSGIDPHDYLLQMATERNMSVYFGIPLPPLWYKNSRVSNVYDIPAAYFEFIRRILIDHKTRYSFSNSSKELNLYNTVEGYMWSDDILLTDVYRKITQGNTTYMDLLGNVTKLIHENKKRFGISTYVQSNKIEGSMSVKENINALSKLVTQCKIDVISVKDGRGSGNGALFWETQTHSSIQSIDPDLYKLLEYYYPTIMHNRILKTFDYFFNFSIFELFDGLSTTRDQLKKSGSHFDLWLNIEAFDALHDDPCLPLDISGSGMDRLLKSVTKSRIDRVLTHTGTAVQKVVSFAWDPSFTCRTKEHVAPLRYQIMSDMQRPIISHCGFHSASNRSVVVIGYNLEGETQSFMMNWPNVNGHMVQSKVYGYYFELDWGIQNDRIGSLMYVQMYDPYDIIELAPKGIVTIKADSAYHGCSFKYDFTKKREGIAETSIDTKVKKYYRRTQKPLTRVYAQDFPFE